jgi:ribosome-binding factor A
MRRVSHRPERVAELIREEVAAFLTSGARDPRIGFVTVTGVEVSGDLGYARVRVSVMGSDEEKERSLAGLESAARYLRVQLAKALHLRVAPELRFALDRGIEHAQRIDRVLGELKRQDDAGDSATGDRPGGPAD